MQRRKKLGEAYWEKTRFNVPTDYIQESKKLKEKGIEVHAFYVAQHAKKTFEEIAAMTNGTCQFLDVNNPNIGQKTLTDKFSEQILLKIGNISGGGLGEKLVADYKRQFA